MKKLLFLAATIMLGVVACSAEEKPIAFEQLPQNAKTFITENFSNFKFLSAVVDRDDAGKDHKVFFADGSQIEFDRKGNWKDIECKASEVPAGAIPAQITSFISENYAGRKVLEISRDRHDYEVKLNDRLELKFDRNFNFLGFD